MLLLAPLRAVDLTLESALALASPAMLSLELKMAPLTIPRLRSCRSTCVPFRASRQCGFGRRLHGSDEDAASATSHTQSHMAEQFFVVGALRLLDLIPPPFPRLSHAPPPPVPPAFWHSRLALCCPDLWLETDPQWPPLPLPHAIPAVHAVVLAKLYMLEFRHHH